jgi:hypothetical protein
MKNSQANLVRFGQKIRFSWFEKVTDLILAGNDRSAVKDGLEDLLKDKLSIGSDAVRGNRSQVVTILLNTWLTVPGDLESLRLKGLELLKILPKGDHLAIHWGMILAVYRFWFIVSSNTGRLLKLQGSVAAPHVQRRIFEQYGERETISRATRRVLRNYIDWGVLRDTDKKGVYSAGAILDINDLGLIAWLAEAFILAQANDCVLLNNFINSPCFFPFRIRHISAEELRAVNPDLDYIRQGIDESLIMLRQTPKLKVP